MKNYDKIPYIPLCCPRFLKPQGVQQLTCAVLGCHMWLVAAMLDSVALKDVLQETLESLLAIVCTLFPPALQTGCSGSNSSCDHLNCDHLKSTLLTHSDHLTTFIPILNL